MKPRLRVEQKQSSRMYLRRKDHRDCIMNDIYHNAIWMKKEQDGEQKDELVWCKYPQNALYHVEGRSLSWIDADREFNFGIGLGGSTNNRRIFRLETIAVALVDTSPLSAYYTEDGIVWKKFKTNPTLTRSLVDIHYFGEDKLCVPIGTTMYISTFEKDEENDEWICENKTMSIPNGSVYCCRSKIGCIIADSQVQLGGPKYTITFHELMIGMSFKREEWKNVPWNIQARKTRDCSTPDLYGFCLSVSERLYRQTDLTSDTFDNQLIFISSSNRFVNTTKREIYSVETGYYQSWYYRNDERMDAFVRNGNMYCIYRSNSGNGHLVQLSEGGNTEIELPNWVDLPLLNGGGKCVGTTTKEFVRLAVRPSSTQNADVDFYSAVGQTTNNSTKLNGYSLNIKFKDGELLNWTNEDEFLVLRANNYILVFDNLQFIPSSKSFAFILATYSEQTDGAETVQPNDYVIRP